MRPLLLVFSLVVAACAETTVVGVTDLPAGPPPSAAKPKQPSMIVLAETERLSGNAPILGDVDGDGYDDFLIVTESLTIAAIDPNAPALTRVHLFYGQKEFPEQLSTADAAAVFSAQGPGQPVGDVDGDGLADFLLQHAGPVGFEIVLGSATRYEGAYEALSAGLHWQSEELPPPVAPQFGTLTRVEGAGDVNCDGVDDLLVSALKPLNEESERGPLLVGIESNHYLVLGGPTLPTGRWNAGWAAAMFDREPPQDRWEISSPGQPFSYGDLDADGCDDLVAMSDTEVNVYYGHANGWAGSPGWFMPGGQLPLDWGFGIMPLGDLDGDGAADFAVTTVPTAPLLVVYGSKDRWTQEPPRAELTIELDMFSRFVGDFSVAVGDIDGDAEADLVIGSSLYGLESGVLPMSARGAMYALRGIGERTTGTHVLRENDLLLIGPPHAQSGGSPLAEGGGGPGIGATLSVAGDVDGDGASDIVTGSPGAGDHGAVYFIPSGPPTPR